MYKNGTIKLTHLDPNDYTILNSEMFDSIDKALQNTNGKKKWLIMQLNSSDGSKYSWTLLPYGHFKEYTTGMYFSDRPALKYASYGLMALGVYGIYKMIVQRK
tara:strand:+ start:385 stop:693 length:309 start_codon:yes stop_codon:yes gene_type:complete